MIGRPMLQLSLVNGWISMALASPRRVLCDLSGIGRRSEDTAAAHKLSPTAGLRQSNYEANERTRWAKPRKPREGVRAEVVVKILFCMMNDSGAIRRGSTGPMQQVRTRERKRGDGEGGRKQEDNMLLDR